MKNNNNNSVDKEIEEAKKQALEQTEMFKRTELMEEIKKLCVKYFKENGLYQSTINDILLSLHIDSHDLFSIIFKDVPNEQNTTKANVEVDK